MSMDPFNSVNISVMLLLSTNGYKSHLADHLVKEHYSFIHGKKNAGSSMLRTSSSCSIHYISSHSCLDGTTFSPTV